MNNGIESNMNSSKQHPGNNNMNDALNSKSQATNEPTSDSKSISSRSTRSRGSAVLQRAREYNRIIDENRSRSKSYERNQNGRASQPRENGITVDDQRERAMASVKNEAVSASNARRSAVRTNAGSSSNRLRSSPTPSQKSSSHYKSSQARNAQSAHGASSSKTGANAGKSSSGKSNKSGRAVDEHGGQAIVTPELLVDALSGHEDGLLAIAERLMEHYDAGYDVMGEAIIDAFADVQKLFQHVVEAAHMEGAAYEAGRKEEEIERLKRALGGEAGVEYSDMDLYKDKGDAGAGASRENSGKGQTSTSPIRHEEFIDQDVKDVLLEAIRKGQPLKESNKYSECFRIYEEGCNSASALLPVDSDHRGRLQLSIARAESMSAERACAILRYVMDDVLRSGLNSNSKVVMPDPSKRGDCVLSRPEGHGIGRYTSGQGVAADESGVLQSSEEALNSMVEEMKEILSAPLYDNSPLRNVAERFWIALAEAQKNNIKNEERLEQKLASLKAELLLAREEWEEKYNALSFKCNSYKKKIEKMKQTRYMEQARVGISQLGTDESSEEEETDGFLHPQRPPNLDSPRPTNVSGSSSFISLSQHAKSLVGSFGCSGRKGYKRDSSPPSAASTQTTRKTLSMSSASNFTRR